MSRRIRFLSISGMVEHALAALGQSMLDFKFFKNSPVVKQPTLNTYLLSSEYFSLSLTNQNLSQRATNHAESCTIQQ